MLDFVVRYERVEIHRSARRHGVDDDDITHAIAHRLVIDDLGEEPDRWLVIGPDRAGNLLEIVVLISSDGDKFIHPCHVDETEVPKAARIMTTPRTSNGRIVTDAEIEALADEAERGYDPADLIARRGKRGRPTLGGAGPSTVESVRLDPELNEQIAARAEQDGVTTSDVIREALRRYLHAS